MDSYMKTTKIVLHILWTCQFLNFPKLCWWWWGGGGYSVDAEYKIFYFLIHNLKDFQSVKDNPNRESLQENIKCCESKTKVKSCNTIKVK